MNTENETIVSGKMLDELRKAGVDQGYEPVPQELERRARKLLGRKNIVSYASDSKLKKQIVRLKNRLQEARLREGANSPVVIGQLAALERFKATR
jgi:hypothetical protein